MIKAAIFDIVGLLIDTEPLWDKADMMLLKRRGITPSKEHARKLLLKRLGTGSKSTMELYKKEFNIDEDTKDMVLERVEIVNDLFSKNLRLMEGGKKLINLFDQIKIIMAVATGGHTRKNLIQYLQYLKIAKYFPVIVTLDEVRQGKPDPTIFLYAAKKLGVLPSDCLVLEDAPSGIEAGKRAGMYAFGVNRLSIVRKKLEQSGADQVFASLKEIGLQNIP